MNGEQNGKSSDVGFAAVMGDATNIPNEYTVVRVDRVQQECEWSNSHRSGTPRCIFPSRSSQRPVRSSGEISDGFEGA